MYTYDFGDGRLGDVEIRDGVTALNSYARVVDIQGSAFKIENEVEGNFGKIAAGDSVLVHVSATNGTDAAPLGKYIVAQVLLRSDDTLTLNLPFDVDLNFFYVQIVSIPQFRNLTLTNAVIAPPPFDVFKFTGGICAFQVFNNFVMKNSSIDLTQRGIPTEKKLTYRPLTAQEYGGETDGSKLAGQENFITSTNLLLNSGDGAVFIQAYNFEADSDSRIGNPKTHGRAHCRGAADSPFKPSNVTNIGGSSILVVSEKCKVESTLFAKYRSSELAAGRGLARCYIASNTILDDDEKLYAFDILQDLEGVQKLGVQNFGNGTLDITNPAFQLNNVAQVAAVIDDAIYFEDKTLTGYAKFHAGNLILQKTSAGNFYLSRIITATDNFITVDKILPDVNQVIAVPEFNNLTLENYSGAVFAAAVADTFTLTGNIDTPTQINCGNSQSYNKFDSIFILAKKIQFGENARLNAGTMIITEDFDFNPAAFNSKPNFIWYR